MRDGVIGSTLPFDPKALAGDNLRRTGSSKARKEKAEAFELPSHHAGRSASWNEKKTAAAHTPPSRTEETFQARREVDRPRDTDRPRNEASQRRSDPPRRTDPPRGADAAHADEPPRRDDPPGLAPGEEAPATEAAATTSAENPPPGEETPSPEEAAGDGVSEEASSELAEGELLQELASTDAVTPGPVEADPQPSQSGLVAAEPAGAGILSSDVVEAVAGAAGQPIQSTEKDIGTPEAESQPGPGHVTGLARAIEVISEKGRDLPPGLEKAAGEPSSDEPSDLAAELLDLSQETGSANEPKAKSAGPTPGGLSPTAAESAKANADPKIKPVEVSGPILTPEPSGSAGLRAANPAAQPSSQPQAAAPQHPMVHNVPLGAVPIEIGLKSLAGANRFEIRLDPAELGRIDVSLEIDESGEVKAHLVVDRVETLSLLQRDAKTLERAFEQAGLKPSEGGVDLSLRDPSSESRQQRDDGEQRGSRNPQKQETEPAEQKAAPVPRTIWRGATGVDLRV